MKRIASFAAAAAFALGAAAPAAAQTVEGPSVAWNLSTWGNPRAFTAGIEKMAELLDERTEGKFKVTIHYGGALSKSRENLDGIHLGAFQMAMFCNFYHPGKNATLMSLTMPFLPMGDWEKNVAVRDAVYAHPDVVAEMAKWNAMLYVSTYLPQYEFLGRGDAPASLDDWTGMRVRAGGGVGKAMEAIGAIPTTTTATEVYTAMQRGTVDAASFPFTYSHVAYKIHEVADWYTANLSPGTSDCPVVINTIAYDALPDQYKQLLEDIKPEIKEAQVAAYQEIDKKNLPMLKDTLKEVVLSDEALADFRARAGGPVIEAWVAENQDKFDAQGIIDLINETAAAVE